MSSKPPVVKQIAWVSIIPQLTLLAGMIALSQYLKLPHHVITGVVFYLMLSFALRFGIPFHHRKGIALFKKGSYKEAIPFFKKSHAFFQKHPWLDTYRYVTMLSSSEISYRETALLNIAFCHGQSGNGEKSRAWYEKTLEEFPDSEMAKSSLAMFDTAQNVNRSASTASGSVK